MIKQVAEGEEHLNTEPEPDYAFRDGDIMLVLVPNAELSYLRRGYPRTPH
jgi:hypothetical protein